MRKIIAARGPYVSCNYEEAELYCLMFEQDGYRNWRMPTMAERNQVVTAGQPVIYAMWTREDCVVPYMSFPCVPVRTADEED